MTPLPNLLERARTAEPEALSQLYHAHAETMLRVAYHLLGSRADAEDVVHDVFLGLPEALHGYREQGKFASWINRIAVRTALGRMRRQRREISIDLVAERLAEQKSEPVSDWLERGIRSLPETLRIVFVLREIEGYSHNEIGELLGIRRGTSEVRYHRAIKQLQETLKEAL